MYRNFGQTPVLWNIVSLKIYYSYHIFQQAFKRI
jgi:hypothetical protein